MKFIGAARRSSGRTQSTAIAGLSLGLSISAACASGARVESKLPVIPMPVEAVSVGTRPFQLSPATLIISDQASSESAARTAEAVQLATGVTLKIDSAARAASNIVLRLDTKLFPEHATAQHGLFNGAQTLAQLILPAGKAEWQLAACEVKDYPRFQWRGLLLDPARHFLPPDYLKKFIELMACYKYNRLQLHLTDDQGWRIEIKKDPRLTEIGSVRKQSPKRGDRDHGDGQVYGPYFYTQAQIHELVTYALARHVVLVPEIEIPGHFGAAIASHPELSCSGKVSDEPSAWGMNGDILCPGNDAGVAFAHQVLGEVCDLFPSEFIHIGGDEVPRERWKACLKCQARIKAEGLKNEAQLQTWLNHRLEEFLTSKGRRMIGWDEILEGGLTPGAVVMSWRGTQGGIDAAKAGHDVIMSPTTHCYFDYAQAKGPNEPECIGGFIPLAKVYSFEAEPQELSEAQRRHILGAQGNIWGEYIRDGNDVEYFAFPRALALVEVIWSPVAGRNFENFVWRLNAQYPLLDRLKVHYRKPDAETTRLEVQAKPESK